MSSDKDSLVFHRPMVMFGVSDFAINWYGLHNYLHQILFFSVGIPDGILVFGTAMLLSLVCTGTGFPTRFEMLVSIFCSACPWRGVSVG